MQKSNLRLIYIIFFCDPIVKSHNCNIHDLNNPTIGRSNRPKKKKTKLNFIKDNFKEILALTTEWSY